MSSRIIIDVREPFEYASGHVKGALNLPPEKLMAGAKQLEGIPKDTEIILYCRSGARSAASASILQRMGYTNLINGINKDQVKARYL